MAKINKTSDPYWDELWVKLGGMDGLMSLYYETHPEALTATAAEILRRTKNAKCVHCGKNPYIKLLEEK
jgi:hypothetical protein